MHDPDPDPDECSHKSNTNGWWLFYKDASSRRVVFPGETAGQCCRRIWQDCLKQWNDDSATGKMLRNHWHSKAIIQNKQKTDNSNDMVECKDGARDIVECEEVQDKLGANLQVHQGGKGPLGLGDTSFALSIATVTEADDKTPGFVRNYANKWVSRTSALVKPTPTKGASTQLSCFQDIGFCHSKVAPVKNRYKLIVDNLRKIVADHRKHHLVKGRNKGPSVSIQHPLVLMSTKSSVMLN